MVALQGRTVAVRMLIRNRSTASGIRLLASERERLQTTETTEVRLATHLGRSVKSAGLIFLGYSAIREATLWYQEHLSSSLANIKRKASSAPSTSTASESSVQIVLLSDDAGNRKAAKELGLQVHSVREYVDSLPGDKATVLGDLVAQLGEISPSNLSGQEGARSGAPPKTTYAPEYLPASTLQAGVRAGTLHQGYFNLDPYNYREGTVKVHSYPKPILLVGGENMNRSVTGDQVVVEVLDESEWRAPADEVLDEESESYKGPVIVRSNY